MFPEVDDQISADWLAIYATGSVSIAGRESINSYSKYREVVESYLGNGKELREEINNLINEKKKDWYPKIREKIKQICGNLDQIVIDEDDKRVLDLIFPSYKEYIRNFENEENPIKKCDWKRTIGGVVYILNKPLKDLSRKALLIPQDFVNSVRKYTKLIIGEPHIATIEYNTSLSIKDILTGNYSEDQYNILVMDMVTFLSRIEDSIYAALIENSEIRELKAYWQSKLDNLADDTLLLE